MGTVETRCTQCRTVNKNELDAEDTNLGTGKAHGTEVVLCTECSAECKLDECKEDDPCEKCWTETVQNRCGSSVPTAKN